MGTSSSYGGPRGNTPLLPPWADDEPSAAPTPDGRPGEPAAPPTPRPLPPGDWARPRELVRQFARSGRTTRGGLRGLGRSYTRAAGGAGTAARAAAGGRRSTAGLSGLLADTVRSGLATALTNRGLGHLLGLDLISVLASLTDYLAPAGASLEEAAARSALTETLEQVFGEFELEERGLDALEKLDEPALGSIIERSIANYIGVRLLQQLVIEVEKASISEDDANRLMVEMKDFISEIVKLDIQDMRVLEVDWAGPEGQALMRRWYVEGYRLFGS